MNAFEKSKKVMSNLFSRDYQFALATANENAPSVRVVDTYYEDSNFYVVTYAKSQKVKEIEQNPNVSLCSKQYRFTGLAFNIGHPLEPQNTQIREKLIKEFEPWYFAHNNEKDENMCYVRIELTNGFLYQDGVGYSVDFKNEEAKEFPFEHEIIISE